MKAIPLLLVLLAYNAQAQTLTQKLYSSKSSGSFYIEEMINRTSIRARIKQESTPEIDCSFQVEMTFLFEDETKMGDVYEVEEGELNEGSVILIKDDTIMFVPGDVMFDMLLEQECLDFNGIYRK